MEIYPDFPVLMLVEHLDSLAALSAEDLRERRKRREAGADEAFEKTLQSLDPSSAPFSLPDTAFARPNSDNDLDEQLLVLTRNFGAYIRTGWDCPPYAAWRVAVILRKMKRIDLERAFLSAWVRHFPIGPGVRYEALVDRSRKMGIDVGDAASPTAI